MTYHHSFNLCCPENISYLCPSTSFCSYIMVYSIKYCVCGSNGSLGITIIKIQRNFCRAAMLPFYILKKKLSSPMWHIFKGMLLYFISEHQIVTLVTHHKMWVCHFVITDWRKLRKCVVGLVVQWHHIYSKFPDSQLSGLKVEMYRIHTHTDVVNS